MRRFVARRGVPAAIFSDNGTNFIGARNELIQLKLILAKRRNSVSQFATNLGTQWTMGTCPNSLPEDPRQLNISSERRYHLVKKMRQQFWNRWSRGYLNQLQNMSKWKHSGRQPKVHDLVLIAEDNTTPLQWPLARILELYQGNDEIARVAKIKTKNATLIRPVTKLRPFPSEISRDQVEVSHDHAGSSY